MTKVLSVASVQHGDTIVENQVPYVVDYIEKDTYCYDLMLHKPDGGKMFKCVPIDGQVIVEL
jgi:hypothetical protein